MILPSLTLLTCTNPTCEEPYIPATVGAKFCPRCTKKISKTRLKEAQKGRGRAKPKSQVPMRNCADPACGLRFRPKTTNQKYHLVKCSERHHKQLLRAKKRQALIEQAMSQNRIEDALGIVESSEAHRKARDRGELAKIANVTAQRGDEYAEFVNRGLAQRVKRGEFRQAEMAKAFGVTEKTISVWMAAFEEDLAIAKEREGWSQPADALPTLLALSPVTYTELRALIGADIDAAVEMLCEFRSRNFRDEEGKPYTTPRFQRRWLKKLLKTLVRGGRCIILSPPRHGKSQLLIHLCAWLIVQCPNIRILWIGGNGDIAKLMGGAVREELEHNERLLEYLPPGETYKPKARSGSSWTDEEFTVATRTITGIKSPTFRAVGCGGKILSRDVDLGVGDDVIDIEDAYSPAEREKRKSWINTQVSSRKEDHTALAFIGSRQHHLDWYGEATENSQWDEIVDSAHDEMCALAPPHPHGLPDGHDGECPECVAHVECVLWPEKRTMAFLMDQRGAMDNETHYQMVYLNLTRPEGAIFLTKADIESCHDATRAIGTNQFGQAITSDETTHAGLVLIAGLDPAQTSDQAAVLWGYEPVSHTRFLIDTDIQRAGGLYGAEEVIKRWHGQYGLRHWVIERNRYQDAIRQAKQITDYTHANAIILEAVFTDVVTKWNPEYGIPYQMQLFKADPPKINLPWAPVAETREKVNVYARQLLNFESEEAARKHKRKNDLVMAGFFPETVIRRWQYSRQAQVTAPPGLTTYNSRTGYRPRHLTVVNATRGAA